LFELRGKTTISVYLTRQLFGLFHNSTKTTRKTSHPRKKTTQKMQLELVMGELMLHRELSTASYR